jgi:uncharacterized protein YbgA (DUF1722 family)
MNLEQKIYQLTYKSKAVSEISKENLQDILKTADLHNKERNITGCLLYYNGYFSQILEGNKEDVLYIYDKIVQDSRHEKVELLWDGETDKRYFPNWNMSFFSPETQSETLYVNNYIMLSQFSDVSSGSTLSFWSSVQKIINSKKN